MTSPQALTVVLLLALVGVSMLLGALISWGVATNHWRREMNHAKRQADTERWAVWQQGEDARSTAYDLQQKLNAAYDLIAVLQVRLRR